MALLTPLLTAEMRAHPAWRCWVKLVEVHSVFILHELTVSDIERLDDLQLEHAERFANVPDYAGLTRPKLHFLSHIAQDVWRYGPPRGLWCYGFEGFNRVIKAGAKRSNFKCESVSIMEYYASWVARSLASKKRRRL